MSKLLLALFVAAGLGVAGCATQGDAPMTAAKPMAPVAPISKDAYDQAVKNAEAQYKMDKDACSSRSGNAKDICLAEANGKEMVAKADAEAAYKNTPKVREDARVTRAEATYNVAKEKCDGLSGNSKDVCVKEASAVLVKAKADAKVDRVTADTRQDAAAKQADARKEANADKRDAEYKVAVEKCDALAGSAKDACISNAKAQYGKS
jgi:type IV secretory pathway VirB10-like protein